MADPVSPEEKLFNIIKEGKDSGSGGGVSKPKNPSATLGGIKRFFGSLKLHPGANKQDAASASAAPRIDIDPGAVNRALSVVLLAVASFFVYYLFSTRPDADKIIKSVPKTETTLKAEVERFAPLESYLAETRKRNIFRPAPKDESKGAPTSREAMEKLKEAARDLKVVGISWGETPKALIRSERDKTTYFLKQGQQIGATDVDIRMITKQKVTIGYKTEEFELP
ncbi:MAG TPA: hypothetical protein PLA52_03850 [Candidatus Omnitrophota bacterium]|nr:hypothetical protein [Candidatus Omnitrophota bacterium]HRZ67191.1 hypothetical protein [Candidatus Omnitrophota bacterium]